MANKVDTIIEVHLFDNEEISVVDLGDPSVPSPVAAFNTISILSQKITSSGPNLVIDRRFGEYIVLTLQNDITSFQVLNWPPPPYLGRIHLDIFNRGSFRILNWPPGCVTPYGEILPLTPFGNDFIVLTTIDGGANIKISVVSPNYLPLQ